jgi:ppGpp synthetase/RelA/SpoT-type nucleotidyltranferase
MALSSEEDAGEVESEVGSFNSRSEELAINQEKRISAELTERHEVFGAPLVKLAFELSRCAHTGKLRKNGETYLSHVVETAEVLANLGLDEQTVAAGLLHDVLDDTMMTEQQLREYIPHEVVDMVVGASRMSQVSQMNRNLVGTTKDLRETQVDRFRNMLLSMADVRVVLIKLADRLHNMRTLNALTPEKQRIIAQETMHVFVPLANRLGVWSIKAELEDLCFRYLNQPEFLALQNCLKDDFMRSQKENLQKNLDKLQDELRSRNFGIKDLRGRPKNIYGIHKKMKKKGISFEEVYDLCACRVIVKSKSECYKVLDLIHSIWKPVEGKLRDYVKNPKENGYESLHTVVVDEHGHPFEIQIRTAEMHFIAEYGVAAHWQYKENDKDSKKQTKRADKRAEQQIAWNRWLLTWQMELQDRKFRPSGSPDNPRGVFSSFPEDEPCPPSVEEMDYDPIYAIVASQGKVNVKEVPARCSLYQFSKDILKTQPGTQFLVNNEYHDDADDYTLQMGDLVEVVEMESTLRSSGSSGSASGISYFADEFDVVESDDEPVFDLFDFERQKLDKMYSQSSGSFDYLTKSSSTNQDEEIVV